MTFPPRKKIHEMNCNNNSLCPSCLDFMVPHVTSVLRLNYIVKIIPYVTPEKDD